MVVISIEEAAVVAEALMVEAAEALVDIVGEVLPCNEVEASETVLTKRNWSPCIDHLKYFAFSLWTL